MSTALYRRYRPESFADVIGQEHVTEPLMQALRTGRTNHAYLFSGPRGCGKTTSARILARCLNCEQGPTPTPCGECPSCVALARGGSGSVDVIEIDAASHGGVDDARDLREKASYGPAQSRYKVYIIDEAHMVTPQGFNALLKIVEEPPEHVKFIFATTEPEKVIGTIRSRTHHYPFRLVPPARLQDYLDELCTREGVAVEPGVLSFVIRAGGGSVRDSLSVLDQLIAGSGDEGLTYAGAAALLGFTEGELLDAAIDAFAARDGAAVFRQVDRVIETGQDPRRFVEDLLERLRDLIVVAALNSAGGDGASAIFRGIPQDQLDRMQQQAAAFGPGELSYAADAVNAGLTEMTGATSPRLQLELICARLLLPRSAGEHGFAARIDRIEQRLEMAGPQAAATRGREARPTSGPRNEAPPRPAEEAAPTPPAVEREDAGAAAGSGESAGRPVATSPGGSSVDAAAPDSGRAPTSEVATRATGSLAAADRPVAGAFAPRSESDEVATSDGHDARGHGSAQAPAAAPSARTGGSGGAGGAEQRGGAPTQPAEAPRPAPGGLDTDALRRAWPDVLAKVFGIRRVTWTFLSEHAQVLDYDGERLLIGIATRGLTQTFRNGHHGEVVRQALIDARGIDTRVEGIVLDDAPAAMGAAAGSGRGESGQGVTPGGAGPASPRSQAAAPVHRDENPAGRDRGDATAEHGTRREPRRDPSVGAGPAISGRGEVAASADDDPAGVADARAQGPSAADHGGTQRTPDAATPGVTSTPNSGTGPAHGSAALPPTDEHRVGDVAARSPDDQAARAGLQARADASREAERAQGWSDAGGPPAWAAEAATSSTEAPRGASVQGDHTPPEADEPPPFDDEPPFDDDAWGPPQPVVRPGGADATEPDADPETPSAPSVVDREAGAAASDGQAGPAGAADEAAVPTAGRTAPPEVPHQEEPRPDGPRSASGARGIEAFRAARRAQRDRVGASGAAGAVEPSAASPVGADDVAARDDEDITDLSAVGQPVIAAVLGGTVIAEHEE